MLFGVILAVTLGVLLGSIWFFVYRSPEQRVKQVDFSRTFFNVLAVITILVFALRFAIKNDAITSIFLFFLPLAGVAGGAFFSLLLLQTVNPSLE